MSDQVPDWDFMDSIDDDDEKEDDGPSQPPPPPPPPPSPPLPPPRLGVSQAGGGLVDVVHLNSASHPILTWHQIPCSSLILGEETISYDHTSPSRIFTSFSNSQYQEPPAAICHDHHLFQLGQKGESSSQVQSGTTQTQHPQTQTQHPHTQTQVTNSCVAELSTGIPEHGKRPKRTRSAETHNRSERRRRDRIRGKMKALQELIPNCNKTNRAAMLDEAVEYLKFLKYQVQVMSTGGGILLQPPFHMSPAAQYQSTQIPQYTPTLSTWRPRGQTMGMPFPSPNLYPSPSAGNFVPPGFPHVQVPLNPLQPYPERTSVQPALIPTFSFSSQLGDSTSQTLPTMSNDRFTAHIQAMTQEYVMSSSFTALQLMGGLVRTTSSSDSTVAELPHCEKGKKKK